MKMKQTPQQKPAQEALQALIKRMGEIKAEREADHTLLVKLDVPGRTLREHTDKLSQDARSLLNGAVEGLLPPVQPDVSDQIRVLKRKIDVAAKALEEGDRLVQRLTLEAAAERLRLRADDITAAMGGIAEAVMALESALQKRDALVKEIKPAPNTFPGMGWVFLGRVGRSESQSYQFLQAAANAGWISQERFKAAVKKSREALN